MGSREHVDMGPGSVAILQALVLSSEPARSRAEDAEASLARFACGWATQEEAEDVIDGLARSASLRRRLIEMRHRIAAAERDMESQSRVFHQDPVLANALKSAFGGCVKMFARWDATCRLVADRESLDRDTERSLGVVLRSLGRRMREGAAEGRVALVRGGASAKQVVVEPGELVANLSVVMHDDESLKANAHLATRLSEPKELSLYLVEPNGGWVWLGSSLASGDRWSLETGGFSALTNLDSESVTIENFALAEGRFFQPRSWIPVWANDQLKRSMRMAIPSRLRISKGPVVTGQRLFLTFDFPVPLRKALHDSQMVMSLDMGVTSFVLGSWPVSQLPTSGDITVEAAVPGVPDCELRYRSAVSLMFRTP